MGRGNRTLKESVKAQAQAREVTKEELYGGLSRAEYDIKSEAEIKEGFKDDLAQFFPDTDFSNKFEKANKFMKKHNQESVELRSLVYGPYPGYPEKIRPETPNWGDLLAMLDEARNKFVDEFITTDYSGEILMPKELDDKVTRLFNMYYVRRIGCYGDPAVGTGIDQNPGDV